MSKEDKDTDPEFKEVHQRFISQNKEMYEQKQVLPIWLTFS